MTEMTYQINIDAPVDEVWAVLADFGNIYKFNPNVKHSHSTSAATEGLGATRHCALLPAGSIEERIIDWQEGRSMDIEIYDGKGAPPFKSAIATVSVEPNGNGTTAYAKINYGMKYGPVGAVMDAVMVKKFLGKGFQGLLAGLKHHIETGEEVVSSEGLSFAAVPA